jgi:hypothetical protein
MQTLVKQNAAQEAEDAASHGYNGREGKGAQLLKLCAKAVRIAAGGIQRGYSVPEVSADERAEYTSDLVARIVGEHGGHIPAAADLCMSYLIERAGGLILNDRHRRAVGFEDTHEQGRDGGAAEAGRDDRLSGPLELTPEVEAVAVELGLSATGTKALAFFMLPGTRAEFAELFGYATPKAFHVVAWRGRRELVAIGEDAIRDALAKVSTDDAAQKAGE